MMHAWFIDGPFKGECALVSGPIKITRVRNMLELQEKNRLVSYWPWQLVVFGRPVWVWSTSDRHPDDVPGVAGVTSQDFLFNLLISPQGRTLAREAFEATRQGEGSHG